MGLSRVVMLRLPGARKYALRVRVGLRNDVAARTSGARAQQVRLFVADNSRSLFFFPPGLLLLLFSFSFA